MYFWLFLASLVALAVTFGWAWYLQAAAAFDAREIEDLGKEVSELKTRADAAEAMVAALTRDAPPDRPKWPNDWTP